MLHVFLDEVRVRRGFAYQGWVRKVLVYAATACVSVALLGCQNGFSSVSVQPLGSANGVVTHGGESVQMCTADARFLMVERSMVHAHHLGRDAQGEAYLLLVLNPHGVERINSFAQSRCAYSIALDDMRFRQHMHIHSGFLVLSPIPKRWDAARVSQLLD